MKYLIRLALIVVFIVSIPYLLLLYLAIPFVNHYKRKQEQRIDELLLYFKK